MNFLYPSFLFALAAIAIPIIIHLFNFQRYERIVFTNVKLLKDIKKQTRSRAKLKHLLVLLSRILAITFLVLAFAQPYIPVSDQRVANKDNIISIFIDNSFSMDAENENGHLFAQAKESAIEISLAYKPTDRFQVITNDFEARHQKTVNQEEVVQLIQDIELSPEVKKLSEIIIRQKDIFRDSESEGKKSFIISDFQKSNLNFGKIESDTNISTTLMPVTPQAQNNIYIDSCWFESPIRQIDRPENLIVRIRNNGDNPRENVPIKLTINGSQKALSSCSLQPNAYEDIVLSFTFTEAGIKNCEVSLTDFPVTFDDRFYFSFNLQSELVILCLSDTGISQYVNSLFENDDYFNLLNMGMKNIDYSKFAEQDLIILNGLPSISSGLGNELGKFINRGGNIVIFPGEDPDIQSYNQNLYEPNDIRFITSFDTIQTAAYRLNLESNFYADVFDDIPENMDLPTVYSHFTFSNFCTAEEDVLIFLRNSEPLLTRYIVGKGTVYQFAISLDKNQSNFSEHAIFVPVMYKIGINSQHRSQLFYTIGDDTPLLLRGSSNKAQELVYHLKRKGSNNIVEFDIIPEVRTINQRSELLIHNQIHEAGNYKLSLKDENKESYSFNYNRRESNLDCASSGELIAFIEESNLANLNVLDAGPGNLAIKIEEMNEGKKLWKLCIIFALAFFAIEVVLLRILR
ncbi:MAG: hypothetical protein COB85_05310 [Bacteroidetes bacterium]|nr:MAG: hypothetical protein COB85_05310 [Bacteroidota bacterium]